MKVQTMWRNIASQLQVTSKNRLQQSIISKLQYRPRRTSVMELVKEEYLLQTLKNTLQVALPRKRLRGQHQQ